MVNDVSLNRFWSSQRVHLVRQLNVNDDCVDAAKDLLCSLSRSLAPRTQRHQLKVYAMCGTLKSSRHCFRHVDPIGVEYNPSSEVPIIYYCEDVKIH